MLPEEPDLRGEGARKIPLPKPVLLLVGDYGSGKTEVAVNLAFYLAAAAARPERVVIADLDLVNPYFRCREARTPLEAAGIRVVMPADGLQFADLPILLPEVKGLVQKPGGQVILDVGGDVAGSRVLASLAPYLDAVPHDFWFVVNANRPFNDTPAGCIATIRRIEAASKLRVTGLVANTHLMADTTVQMIVDGIILARAVAADLGAPLAFVAAMESVYRDLPEGIGHPPVLVMQRLIVPPWLRSGAQPLSPEPLRSGPSQSRRL